MARVVVVGAGVVGLSCAVRLLEAGHRVDVLARDLPEETTSATAAALWYPYRALPEQQVTSWSARSRVVFADLAAAGVPGLALVPGTEVHRSVPPAPWWRDAVPDLERTREVPEPWVEGWTFTAAVVEMPVYLRWLAGRVETLGGTLTRLSLAGLPTGGDMVVNASGIGARLLAGDASVTPVQGQVVRLAQWGLRRWWLDGGHPAPGSVPGIGPGGAPAGPTYIVPREQDVVVGGTDVDGEWSRTPVPAVADAILERAARLVPAVATAHVLQHKVGLRPARPTVRLERVGRVVHCYGHGGAGVTLSWGCADDVAALIGDLVTEGAPRTGDAVPGTG